eukprot:SAG22_NODE_99_length_20560_cov_128.669029_30_plen_40_part_00
MTSLQMSATHSPAMAFEAIPGGPVMVVLLELRQMPKPKA